jgi:hypothetical protein
MPICTKDVVPVMYQIITTEKIKSILFTPYIIKKLNIEVTDFGVLSALFIITIRLKDKSSKADININKSSTQIINKELI